MMMIPGASNLAINKALQTSEKLPLSKQINCAEDFIIYIGELNSGI